MQRTTIIIVSGIFFLLLAALVWNRVANPPVNGPEPASQVSLSQPLNAANIGNPVLVSGTAQGVTHVEVIVEDYSGDWMATSSMPVINGTFSGEVWYRAPTTVLGRIRAQAAEAKTSIAVTFPAERQGVRAFFVPKTTTEDPCTALVARDRSVAGPALRGAIEELLRGPFDLERDSDSTSIPVGTRLLSMSEDARSVRLVFSKELDANIGGSCRVGSIARQIRATVTEEVGPKEVIIAVEGKPDNEVLQP